MRYVAKIHVLDVMDKIVVSGYVYDADPLSDPDHNVVDFAYDVLSYGRDDAMDWLTSALYSALVEMNKAAQKRS